MVLSLSPAAVCQCFTLVSLCTSIADPDWIEVQNSSDPKGRQLIYGVAFTLHSGKNITDAGPLGGSTGLGVYLLYALAAVCYATVLTSSSCFLLDFLGVASYQPKLVRSLHICTAFLAVSILGVFGSSVYVIWRNVREGPLEAFVGESVYIAVLGIFFSFVAAAFSFFNQSEPGVAVTSPSSSLAYAVQEEDDTEPLIGQRQAGRREEPAGREASPD
ncbi:transmembrane protein 127 [Engraulis encrasicolus]|uniref:transmembrane protein 127 n=1 Tax=Engraulis encrasicolus TaxID=184585 RepID=UPI002FD24243